jgi:hypothetical protein
VGRRLVLNNPSHTQTWCSIGWRMLARGHSMQQAVRLTQILNRGRAEALLVACSCACQLAPPGWLAATSVKLLEAGGKKLPTRHAAGT